MIFEHMLGHLVLPTSIATIIVGTIIVLMIDRMFDEDWTWN